MSQELHIAQQFFAAIEAGDMDQIRALYAPDARIWHNTDGISQTVEENLKVLGWLIRSVPVRRYRVIRLDALPDGFVQRHVLELRTPNGQCDIPACIVALVRDGMIARIDEYLDSSHVAAMRAALRL